MADKSQNITINYKFNTDAIAQGEAALKRANEASNKFQQSGEKAGQGIAKGFRQSQQSILSMQIALQRLKTQIEVSTNPASTAKLSAEYRRLKTELDAATKAAFNLSSAQKQTAQNTGSLASQFGNLYQAAKLVVGAGIAREILNTTLNMAKLAGNVAGVERAFKRAFPNSVAVLTQLRDATRGTVSDFELMQQTLRATNLGVAVEQLPVLLEFAAARAQQTGESVDYLVDSIVRGIGRKSPLILDNLGLSAIRLKEKFDGVALASVSVADVTKGVAEIAKEELDKMGGYASNATTEVNQLTTAWEELRVALAKRTEIGTTGLTSFLKTSLQGLRDLITGNKDLFLEEARRVASTDALRVVQSKEYKEFGDNQQAKFDFIQQEINSRVQLIGRYNDNITALKAERQELKNTNPYDKKIENLTATIRAYNDNKVVIAATILALKEYLAAIDLTTDAEEKSIITIKTLKDELADLKKQREEQTFIGNTAELDRLERESLRLEDRILKIADNIEWQKKWSQQNERDKLAQMELTKAIEESAEAVDKLAKKFAGGDIAFSTGDLLPDLDAKETFDLDALEEGLSEVVDTVNQSLGEEFLIRLRLGFQGKGGDTSEIQAMLNEELKKLGMGTFDILTDQFHSIVDAELASYEQRLENLQAFYDNQILLAGDNDKAKKELRIKEERETAKLRAEIARKEKQAKRTHVLIDIAAGIAKAFATYPWPYSLIPAAFVAAQGASQLAIINRQPTNFAKGVIDLKGPGTATSDSIPANLSRGESVMTAWETRMAGDVLKDIRAKKLDNRVLRQLKEGRAPVQSDKFNDERIIKAIKEQKHPDIVSASNIVYESKRYNDNYKKRVRSASMSI